MISKLKKEKDEEEKELKKNKDYFNTREYDFLKEEENFVKPKKEQKQEIPKKDDLDDIIDLDLEVAQKPSISPKKNEYSSSSGRSFEYGNSGKIYNNLSEHSGSPSNNLSFNSINNVQKSNTFKGEKSSRFNKEPILSTGGLDFDTNILLKKEPANPRKRSARRFLEEEPNFTTANKTQDSTTKMEPNDQFIGGRGSNTPNIFDYNNNEFSKMSLGMSSGTQPIIMKSEFPSRRQNQVQNPSPTPVQNSINKFLDEPDMMIGESNFEKKANQNSTNSNNILFGMNSRRGHNSNSNNSQKNWVI